jgi:hypothetical protein
MTELFSYEKMGFTERLQRRRGIQLFSVPYFGYAK